MAATDKFSNYDPGIAGPAGYAEAITKHDTTQFTYASRAIYVGTGGNVAIVTTGGQVVTFVNVQSGTVLPIRAIRVNSTNTTAADMVAIC